MEYCLYNAIKTPDGTVLWCTTGHDYKTHTDALSGEEYMNDGLGYGVRRSINETPYENLSIYDTAPFEKVRTAKFWGSYGKDGKSEKRMMSLEEMEDDHIQAILRTQAQARKPPLEALFLKEIEYRITNFKEHLDEAIAPTQVAPKKIKI